MKSTSIDQALRNESSDDLDIRRKIVALSALGLLDFSIISMYQAGVIRRLPDLPLSVFDSNSVNASKEAYQFGVPDGPVSATVYALTMVLATASGTARSGRKPVWDLLFGGAIAGNAAGAVYYLYEIFKQKKICLYCVLGAAINLTSAALVAPLVQNSVKKITKSGAHSFT